MSLDIFPLLTLVLFSLLVAGLIRPESVLRFADNPTRGKVFLYWFLVTVALGGVQAVVERQFPAPQPKPRTEERRPKPRGYTTTSQNMKEASQAIKKALSAANDRADKSIFKSFRIEDEGRVVYITISDDWYYAKDFVKERLANFIGKRITYIASDTKISYRNGKFFRPIIWFKDTHGKALAHGRGASWEIEE